MSEFYVGDEVLARVTVNGLPKGKRGLIKSISGSSYYVSFNGSDPGAFYHPNNLRLIKSHPYGKYHAMAREICGHE